MRSTCLIVKCTSACDKNTEDGLNLHAAHYWRSHLSSVCVPLVTWRTPLPLENRWGWPSPDTHEMDPGCCVRRRLWIPSPLHAPFWFLKRRVGGQLLSVILVHLLSLSHDLNPPAPLSFHPRSSSLLISSSSLCLYYLLTFFSFPSPHRVFSFFLSLPIFFCLPVLHLYHVLSRLPDCL